MTNLLSKSLWITLLKFSASTLSVILYYLLAKLLTVEQFGLFSLAMSCLLFSVVFAKQGIEQAIVRFTASLNGSLRPFYLFLLSYSTVSAILVAIAVYFASDYIAMELLNTQLLTTLIPYIALIIIFQTWLALNSSILKGKGYAATSLLFTGSVTISLMLIQFAFWQPSTAEDTIVMFVFATLIASIFSFIITFKNLNFTKSNQAFETNKFFSMNNNLFAISFTAMVTQQFASFVLARYSTIEDVGIFSISLKVSLLVSYVLVAMNTITAPQYSKLYAEGELKLFKALAQQSQKLLIFGASCFVFIIFFFAKDISLFFGREYLPAAKIIQILLIGQWFNVVTGSVVSMLIMAGFEKIHLRNTLFLTAIYVTALFVFIPSYGIISAAWITSIIIASKNLISFYFVQKLIFAKIKRQT